MLIMSDDDDDESPVPNEEELWYVHLLCPAPAPGTTFPVTKHTGHDVINICIHLLCMAIEIRRGD